MISKRVTHQFGRGCHSHFLQDARAICADGRHAQVKFLSDLAHRFWRVSTRLRHTASKFKEFSLRRRAVDPDLEGQLRRLGRFSKVITVKVPRPERATVTEFALLSVLITPPAPIWRR